MRAGRFDGYTRRTARPVTAGLTAVPLAVAMMLSGCTAGRTDPSTGRPIIPGHIGVDSAVPDPSPSASPTAHPALSRSSGSTPRPSGTDRGAAPGSSTVPPRPPASYDPATDITDLAPATNGLRLGKPTNGTRHGELLVTVRNNGPEPVWLFPFIVEVPESMTADGGDWAGCTPLASHRICSPFVRDA